MRIGARAATVPRVTSETDNRAGAALARRRWDRPENIERRIQRRVERIAASIAELPALTRAQRTLLTTALRDHGDATRSHR